MRQEIPAKLSAARIREKDDPRYGSFDADGMNGAFIVLGPGGAPLVIIASDGSVNGWEHVSVSVRHRTPNWKEMAFVKDLFWDDEETVVQFHPPKSEYVNNCGNCLHLWRNRNQSIDLPPKILVGVQALGTLK